MFVQLIHVSHFEQKRQRKGSGQVQLAIEQLFSTINKSRGIQNYDMLL